MKLSIIGLTIMSLLSQNLMAQVNTNANTESKNAGINHILEMDLEELREIEATLDIDVRKSIIDKDIQNIEELESELAKDGKTMGNTVFKIKSETLSTLLMTGGSLLLASPIIRLIYGLRLDGVIDALRAQRLALTLRSSRGLETDLQQKRMEMKIDLIESKLKLVNNKMEIFRLNNTEIESYLSKKINNNKWVSRAFITGIAAVSSAGALGAIVIPGNYMIDGVSLVLQANDIEELQSVLEKSKARLQMLQTEIATQQLEEQAAAIN